MTKLSSNPTVQHASLLNEPFHRFLGVEERDIAGETHYFMCSRTEHIGNPLIGTVHGGILASFGEVVAAVHLAKQCRFTTLPICSTMTFDYMRPTFSGELQAIPRIIRVGRRMATLSVEVHLAGKQVCIGRFIFPVAHLPNTKEVQ